MQEKDIAVFVERTLRTLEAAAANSGSDLVPTVEAYQRSGCKQARIESESR
jgi:hypothetical protein